MAFSRQKWALVSDAYTNGHVLRLLAKVTGGRKSLALAASLRMIDRDLDLSITYRVSMMATQRFTAPCRVQ
ncbi:hypothetical protein ACOSYY_15330 [Nitrospira sp. BLG_2]